MKKKKIVAKKKAVIKELKKDLDYDRYEARHDRDAIESMKKRKARKEDKIRDVMREWQAGDLHSGPGPKAPVVTKRKQAIAIALSEAKRKKRAKKR